MLPLKTEERSFIADRLGEAANVAAGAMVFGQFLADTGFSVGLALMGVAVWTTLVASAVALVRRSGK